MVNTFSPLKLLIRAPADFEVLSTYVHELRPQATKRTPMRCFLYTRLNALDDAYSHGSVT